MVPSDGITAIIFYTIIILLIYKKRKNFEFHARIPITKKIKIPIVAQLKTKLGLGLMKSIGEKHSRIIIFLGTVGIYVGYVGMVGIIILLLLGAWQLLTDPNAAAVITPVIPGVKMPGIPFAFPFWHTLISLFIAVVIHEFSHGVVSKAHKIPVKSSGYAQVFILSAAFVEPDEKILEKKSPKIQNAIYAAGPFSNFLTAIVVILILSFVFAPLGNAMMKDSDLTFGFVNQTGPAGMAGITANTTFDKIDGENLFTTAALNKAIDKKQPGDTVTLEDEVGKVYSVTLGDGGEKSLYGIPTGQRKALMGVGAWTVTQEFRTPDWINSIYSWVFELLYWLLVLSIGLGLGNLIPAGPIDGGRMFLIACQKFFGEKKGLKIWSGFSTGLFVFIIILFLAPYAKNLISFIGSF